MAVHQQKKGGASVKRWLLIGSGGLILAAVAGYTSTSDKKVTGGTQDKNCTETEDASSFLQSLVVHTDQAVGFGEPHDAVVHPESHDDPHDTAHEPSIMKVVDTDLLGDSFEPAEHGHDSKSVTEQGHDHGYISLLFLFAGLLLGVLILMFQERFLPTIPFPCLLFLAGLLIGFVHNSGALGWVGLAWESWDVSVGMFERMNPHLALYIFLPALIFSEAMQLNVQRLMSCLPQIILLAGPGVLAGTFLMGAFCYYVLPYSWEWPICLVVGSILSATDPVAVVALFKSLGVAPHLTQLVSGESLFNDGTAVVCFQLMLKVALGGHLSPTGVVVFFANMTVTSMLIGAAIGAIAIWIISCNGFERGTADEMLQVIITISCAYMCFIVAESEASSSGILAVVSGGMMMAAYIWPRFLSKEVVIIVWETIEFIGNTLIFMLSGLLFADSVMVGAEHINHMDFFYLFSMYGAAIGIRAVTIVILWIPMRWCGEQLTWKQGVVMVWCGLRGAVSLALAIIVDLEPMISKRMGTRVMYHVGGIAGLTLLINSTTTAKLLQVLGLTKEPEERAHMMRHLEQHLTEHALDMMHKHRNEEDDIRFKNADPEHIYSMIPKLRVVQVARRPTVSNFYSEEASAARKEAAYRETFLEVVKSEYWTAVESGIIPRNFKVAYALLKSKDAAMSDIAVKLNDWDFIVKQVDRKPAGGRLGKLLGSCAESQAWAATFPFLPSMFPTQNIIDSWKVMSCLSFLEAHRKARNEVPSYFDLSDPLCLRARKKIDEESLEQCRKAEEFLSQVPEHALQYSKSCMLAKKLVYIQIEKLQHLLHHGVLSSSEGEHFYDDLRSTLQNVQIEVSPRKERPE